MKPCETSREKQNENDLFLENMVFTDESLFSQVVSTIHPLHNTGLGKINVKVLLCIFSTYKTQCWKKLLGDYIMGPYLKVPF